MYDFEKQLNKLEKMLKKNTIADNHYKLLNKIIKRKEKCYDNIRNNFCDSNSDNDS